MSKIFLFICMCLITYKGTCDTSITKLNASSITSATSPFPTLNINSSNVTNVPAGAYLNTSLMALAYISNNQINVVTSSNSNATQQVIDTILAPSGISFTSVALDFNQFQSNCLLTIQTNQGAYIKSYAPSLRTPYLRLLTQPGYNGLTQVSNQGLPNAVSGQSSNWAGPSYFTVYADPNPRLYTPGNSTLLANEVVKNSSTALAMDVSISGTIAIAYIDVNNKVHVNIPFNRIPGKSINSIFAGARSTSGQTSAISTPDVIMTDPGISDVSIKAICFLIDQSIYYLVTYLTPSNAVKLVVLNEALRSLYTEILSVDTASNPVLTTNTTSIQNGYYFIVAWVENTNKPYAQYGFLSNLGVVSFPSVSQPLTSPSILPQVSVDSQGNATVVTLLSQAVESLPAGSIIINATTPNSLYPGEFTLAYQGSAGSLSTPATLVSNPTTNRLTILNKAADGIPNLLRTLFCLYTASGALTANNQFSNPVSTQ